VGDWTLTLWKVRKDRGNLVSEIIFFSFKPVFPCVSCRGPCGTVQLATQNKGESFMCIGDTLADVRSCVRMVTDTQIWGCKG